MSSRKKPITPPSPAVAEGAPFSTPRRQAAVKAGAILSMGDSPNIIPQSSAKRKRTDSVPKTPPEVTDDDEDEDESVSSLSSGSDSSSSPDPVSITREELRELRKLIAEGNKRPRPSPPLAASNPSGLGTINPSSILTPSGSLTFSNNANVNLIGSTMTGSYVPPTGDQQPNAASDLLQLRRDLTLGVQAILASHPTLAELAQVPALNSTQRKDVLAHRYVPLAYFLPAPGMGPLDTIVAGSTVGASLTDQSEILRRSLQDLLGEENPHLKTQQAKRLRDAAPHFRRWEDVLSAFCGGLVPLACLNDPIRLTDYTTFMSAVTMEHAKGSYHWPVYLRYIEIIRRKALLAHIPAVPTNADAEAKRAAHIISLHSTTADSLLNEDVLTKIGMEWASGSLKNFENELIDPATLRALLSPNTATVTPNWKAGTATPSSSHSSTEGPADRRNATAKGPPIKTEPTVARFPAEEWKQLVAMSADGKFCRNFLAGRCPATSNCPKGPHLSHAEVKRLLPA
jgi:hypothetical protein